MTIVQINQWFFFQNMCLIMFTSICSNPTEPAKLTKTKTMCWPDRLDPTQCNLMNSTHKRTTKMQKMQHKFYGNDLPSRDYQSSLILKL